MRPANVATKAVFLVLGACAAPATHGIASPPAGPPSPPPGAAGASPSPGAPAADPLARLRERGTLHGEALRIPARGKLPERWLGFLGDADAATAAWYVAPDDTRHPLTPVDRWPVGVRVLGGTLREDTPYLLLETIGVLDQPAGLRAVWTDGEPSPSLEGVRDVVELERGVGLLPRATAAGAAPSPAADVGAVVRALKAAARSDLTLARALAPEGARVELVWQRLFRREVERVDAASFASSPRAKDLFEVARGAAENEACRGDSCTAETPTGSASVVMGLRGGSYVIEGFRLDAPPPPAVTGAPRAVEASSSEGEVTASILRQHARVTRSVLGEAPLVFSAPAGDTIGVALADAECDGPVVAIREAGVSRVFSLSGMCMVGASLTDARFEARFADVDGDGRTDVVMRVAGRSSADAGVVTSLSEVYLAPPPTVQRDEMVLDHGAELALLGGQSVDDAVRAALSVPPRGTTSAEACRVLAGTSQLANFRRASSADVRVLFFTDPGLPTFDARVVPERMLEAGDVRASGMDCADLSCSPTRPFCASEDGESYYWFAWIAGKMRLAGAGFQVGAD